MSGQDLEQRARELLAAEYERDGKTGSAEHIRTQPLLPNKARAVRAIVAALRQQPACVADDAMVGRACDAYLSNRLGGRSVSHSAMRDALSAAYGPSCGARTVPVVDDAMVSALQSTRDRMMAALTPKFGDAFDGDFDVMLEAINTLKRLRTSTPPAPVVDDAMVARALNAKAGNWPVWQLFSCEDEAREIMCIALTAALAGAQGVQS